GLADRGIAGHADALTAGAAAGMRLAGRAMLQINTRESPLMISVITNSTSPISINACRYSSVSASVNSFARTAAIVCCGAKSEAEIRGELPITIVTAM